MDSILQVAVKACAPFCKRIQDQRRRLWKYHVQGQLGICTEDSADVASGI